MELLVFFIVFIISGLYLFGRVWGVVIYGNPLDKITSILSSLFGAFFVSAIIALIYGASSFTIKTLKSETITKARESYELIALKDHMQEKGTAIFLSGTNIDNDLYYYFIIKTKDGFLKKKVRSDHVYIKETTGTPKYVIYGKYAVDVDRFVGGEKKVLYVPKNSIINTYDIDLE